MVIGSLKVVKFKHLFSKHSASTSNLGYGIGSCGISETSAMKRSTTSNVLALPLQIGGMCRSSSAPDVRKSKANGFTRRDKFR